MNNADARKAQGDRYLTGFGPAEVYLQPGDDAGVFPADIESASAGIRPKLEYMAAAGINIAPDNIILLSGGAVKFYLAYSGWVRFDRDGSELDVLWAGLFSDLYDNRKSMQTDMDTAVRDYTSGSVEAARGNLAVLMASYDRMKKSCQESADLDSWGDFIIRISQFLSRCPECVMVVAQKTWRGTAHGVRPIQSWKDVTDCFSDDGQIEVWNIGGGLWVYETDHDGDMKAEIRAVFPTESVVRDYRISYST
jgi:hypothetical protein